MMMRVSRSDIFKYGLLGLGTAIVALGMTLVGIYTFQDSLVLSSTGYFLFVFGYKACWFSAHDVESFGELIDSMKTVLLPENRFRELKFHILTVTGVLMVSYGTKEFAQSIIAEGQMAPGPFAFMISAGYIIAHEGVNRVLI